MDDRQFQRRYVCKQLYAFSGINQLAKAFPQLRQDEIERLLEGVDVYSRHRWTKRPKTYNPLFVRSLRELLVSDLIDIKNLSRHNEGIKYLLIVQDAFSRKVWMFPLKRKTGTEVQGVSANRGKMFVLPKDAY